MYLSLGTLILYRHRKWKHQDEGGKGFEVEVKWDGQIALFSTDSKRHISSCGKAPITRYFIYVHTHTTHNQHNHTDSTHTHLHTHNLTQTHTLSHIPTHILRHSHTHTHQAYCIHSHICTPQKVQPIPETLYTYTHISSHIYAHTPIEQRFVLGPMFSNTKVKRYPLPRDQEIVVQYGGYLPCM